jgi:hypothetical protein
VSEITAPTALARFVERHNDAAAQGDPERCNELLGDGYELIIEGIGLSSLRRAAIEADFRLNELMLWTIGTPGEGRASARYAWRRRPRVGGVIEISVADGKISRLLLRPGYCRVFANLAA